MMSCLQAKNANEWKIEVGVVFYEYNQRMNFKAISATLNKTQGDYFDLPEAGHN